MLVSGGEGGMVRSQRRTRSQASRAVRAVGRSVGRGRVVVEIVCGKIYQ